MNTYTTECYLVIGMKVREWHNGLTNDGKPHFRVAVKKPSTAKDEIAIKINLDIPLALFVRPELTATIKVPEEQQPYQISADVQHRIAEAVRESTGLDLRIGIEAPESST